MEKLNSLNTIEAKYNLLDSDEMYDTNGGLTIVIAGIAFVGWKAAALIAAGVTTLAGAAALGFWNGYHDTKK
ncbi:hypothetical protein JZO73_09820 [Enterococcus plantarum]|uniref:Class IIb bacteriocin, lactobin A/cerein 7B family n=1 Tax=Enterococcus plantarum TaxID=1077675 RepID=A0A2W3Z6T7_9ENTE|nr:hypothetical protein [Enterococcus plantarum]MBO0467827.1 hypothetical protein [Enterococcus plantarum]PZL72127.1 hypothetical protein CI088_10970 [Enterococcus plantarum]